MGHSSEPGDSRKPGKESNSSRQSVLSTQVSVGLGLGGAWPGASAARSLCWTEPTVSIILGSPLCSREPSSGSCPCGPMQREAPAPCSLMWGKRDTWGQICVCQPLSWRLTAALLCPLCRGTALSRRASAPKGRARKVPNYSTNEIPQKPPGGSQLRAQNPSPTSTPQLSHLRQQGWRAGQCAPPPLPSGHGGQAFPAPGGQEVAGDLCCHLQVARVMQVTQVKLQNCPFRDTGASWRAPSRGCCRNSTL